MGGKLTSRQAPGLTLLSGLFRQGTHLAWALAETFGSATPGAFEEPHCPVLPIIADAPAARG